MSEIKKKLFEIDKNSSSLQLRLELKNPISNDQAPENIKKDNFKKESFRKEIFKKEISNESLPIQELANTQRDKTFKCELCGTTFTVLGNLKRHMDNKQPSRKAQISRVPVLH